MRLRLTFFAFLIAALLAFAGCSNNNPQNSDEQTSGNDMTTSSSTHRSGGMRAHLTPATKMVSIPAGTIITVRLGESLSTKTSHAGDSFTATIADPVAVNGAVAIPSGANASGQVTDAKAMGHFKGGALLAITLNQVTVNGTPYSIQTSANEHSEKGKGKRSAVVIGGGAGLGALIGGLAGGGKGAAIGAAAGAGAGTAGAAFTGNKEIELPAESAVSFKLLAPVEIKE
jgi:hypothetical protein